MKQHTLTAIDIQKMFMEWHSEQHGWEFCLFISAAWKFIASLRAIGVYAEEIGEYLLLECSSLEEANRLLAKLPDSMVVSIWHRGSFIPTDRRSQ